MTVVDRLRYDGKRALIVGGATGMGAAAAKSAAELGAEVIVMDYAPVGYDAAQTLSVDLRDPASIDSAVGRLGGPVHAVFSAAGVAGGPDLMKINFIGHRHLIDRLLANDQLPSGSAVCFVSSVAGMGWENDLPRLTEFLATPDYGAAQDWVSAHEAEGIIHYGFSKKTINAYVATRAYRLLKRGIRINAICPGPTDTPLAQANADLWLTFAQDYRDKTGSKVHTPEQMGDVMVFLNSAAAFGISGITLLVDYGHTMSSLTGAYPPGKPIIDLIMGRVPMP
ncbi:3-alpha-hydroxysteroid dehydrogenase/carbonyl reductase [Mycobacterium shottsii]|uniref:3-alpha-hydroxysteroid dehydrogenase n=1 Tax=Mycobacterium shottsii TaxID=133549 RepID=A0A7I7LA67_9MYCO|nr:SDR family oxidoreductase [Mycobacterium shottsii]QYL26795.1 3-alpha-hydroxysteroid dehydrogenase/carbonyl reductase [Mycobacterium shottsii]BBX56392.1 3-alpha-hydroxysteroid dehydrogenase [Mycobacterium shottsii]